MDVSRLKDLIEKTKKLKVLYVEDNEEVRNQTLKILENFFDEIDTAIDGIEGLILYRQDDKHYDLVISDISMPHMNGVDMSRAIIEIDANQHILILSAHNDSQQLQELISTGIAHYIHKPVHIDSLNNELLKISDSITKKNQEDEEYNKIQALNQELDALVNTFDTYVIASRTDLDGKIIYTSKAYQEISGYTKSELLGEPHNIVRHPDMHAYIFKDMWNTIQNEKLWFGEIKNLRKDGTYYWVKANIAPYYDKYKNHIGYSAIRIDITAQKEVEELHAQVNTLLDNSSQGFLSFDKNMSIEKSFSKKCLSIFERRNIYLQNISDLLFEDDDLKRDSLNNGIKKILHTDETITKGIFLALLPQEHIIRNKNIKIEYKLLSNDKFMLILTDITYIKRLEKQIQEQR